MRESDFGPVDGTIAGCFDEGEDFGVMGVTDEPIDSMLRSDGIRTVRFMAHWVRCVPLTSPSSLSATKRTGSDDAVACRGQGDRWELSRSQGYVMACGKADCKLQGHWYWYYY